MQRFRCLLALGAVCAALAPAASPAAPEILKPAEAFRYETTVRDGAVIVTWTIEPEHYLYKERMSYASRSADISLGTAEMPAGKPYEDEFFGRMEIYRGSLEIRLPILSRPPGPAELELEINSQGCADIGLCYPPQTWMTAVSLDASGGGKLSQLLNRPAEPRPGAGEPLPAELAFKPAVEIIDPFNLRVRWTIADGYYLYRDSLTVATSGEIAQPGPPVIPPGTPKWDEHFGDTFVFYGETTTEVALSRSTPAPALLELRLGYQGCKEDSICYPPGMREIAVALPAATAADAPRPPPAEQMVSEQDRLSGLIVDANLALVIATFTGLGLLLAFTPCVLPMVPILSGIIAGQGENVTTRRAFALSVTYVLGMAVTYTLAGAAFAAAGGQIQAALQKTWIIVGVAALFVALALSMFGAYELRVPAAIQNRLTAASNQQPAGTFFGTAVMGALSALIVTTCVAPPLVASLTVIAQAGDVLRGALALFALSIGMGIPLLIVGTSAGRLLPRVGAWMNAVKGAFGFALLGLAVWMLERVLPGALSLSLWAALIFMAGVFLGAFQPLAPDAGVRSKLGKGFGLLAALYGAALLIGALGGAEDPLQPLRAGLIDNGRSAELEFRPIKTVADLEREVAAAAANNKPVMLDFYADWCVSCKEMERYTFTADEVHAALAGAVVLQADVTANDAQDQALLQHFGIFGPPTIIFFRADGREQLAYRIVGFVPAGEFAAHVREALFPGQTA